MKLESPVFQPARAAANPFPRPHCRTGPATGHRHARSLAPPVRPSPPAAQTHPMWALLVRRIPSACARPTAIPTAIPCVGSRAEQAPGQPNGPRNRRRKATGHRHAQCLAPPVPPSQAVMSTTEAPLPHDSASSSAERLCPAQPARRLTVHGLGGPLTRWCSPGLARWATVPWRHAAQVPSRVPRCRPPRRHRCRTTQPLARPSGFARHNPLVR